MFNFFRDIFRILGVFGALLLGAVVLLFVITVGSETLGPILQPYHLSDLKIFSFLGTGIAWFWPLLICFLILSTIFSVIRQNINLAMQKRTGYVVLWHYIKIQGDFQGLKVSYEENGNYVQFNSRDEILRLPTDALWQQVMPAFIAQRRMEVLIRMRNRIPDDKVTFHQTTEPHNMATISQ